MNTQQKEKLTPRQKIGLTIMLILYAIIMFFVVFVVGTDMIVRIMPYGLHDGNLISTLMKFLSDSTNITLKIVTVLELLIIVLAARYLLPFLLEKTKEGLNIPETNEFVENEPVSLKEAIQQTGNKKMIFYILLVIVVFILTFSFVYVANF